MTADPTATVRQLAYTLMIAIAAAIALARIFAAERVYEPHLFSAEGVDEPVRKPWPKNRPMPMPTFSSNDRSRWAMVRALVENGTFVIGQRVKIAEESGYRDEGIVFEPGWETFDKVLKPETQEFYSSKPPLLPVLAAGEYWLLRNLFGWTLVSHPWHVVGVVLVTFNVLPFVVYLLLLVRLVERYSASDWSRLFVVAAACFGTLLTPFLNTFNNHTIGTFCALIALAAAAEICFNRTAVGHVSNVPEKQPVGNVHHENLLFLLAGLCAGAAASCELPALLFTVLLGVLLLRRSPWRTIVLYGGAALLPLLALEATNYLELGQWQPAYAEFGGPWYEYAGSHWKFTPGDRGIDWAAQRESKWLYALHLLIGHHGFFSLTPLNLLGLIGLCWAVRQLMRDGVTLWKREALSWAEIGVLTLGMSTVIIAYYLYKSDNYGGFTNGPRWLMWLAPFWLLASLPVVERLGQCRWGRGLALALLMLSIFSASYSSWNPWRHPWIYDWMNQQRWIDY